MKARRNRLARAEWWNQIPWFHAFCIGGASGPYPMAGVNAKVVQESAIALNYGPKFVYYERYVPVGFKGSLLWKALSILSVVRFQICAFLGMTLLKLPLIGSWVAHGFFPVAPHGKPDAHGQHEVVEVYAEVQSKSTGAGDGALFGGRKVNKANCFLKFQGDSGNLVTAQCVCEAALCLLFDKDSLPPTTKSSNRDGFGSPAEILGETLVKRLITNQIRPVQCITNVRMATPQNEWRMIHHE